MAGTHVGGIKTARTVKRRYGEDVYERWGSIGGKAIHSKPRGFAAMTPEKRAAAASKGGAAYRRHK